jgi:hypothetical protein
MSIVAPLLVAASISASPAEEELKLEDLAWLIGTWEYKITAEEDTEQLKKGQTFRRRRTYSWALNKEFIKADVQWFVDDEERFTWVGYFGVDGASGKVKTWNFTSGGTHGIGEWSRERNGLRMQWQVTDKTGGVRNRSLYFEKLDDSTIEVQRGDQQERLKYKKLK